MKKDDNIYIPKDLKNIVINLVKTLKRDDEFLIDLYALLTNHLKRS